MSSQRLAESLEFVPLFRIGSVGTETALRYARIVAHLRQRSALPEHSKTDLWIGGGAVVSNINGLLGSGHGLNTVSLSSGAHTITVFATDSEGNVGSASAQISVLAP